MSRDFPTLVNRAPAGSVALETTLLLHGVPREIAPALSRDLADTVRRTGAHPVYVGLHGGVPTVGLNEPELSSLFEAPKVAKANASNMGVLMHRRQHGATTVSTTLELASLAGVRYFATGGIGGIHKGYGSRLDISADLAALARFPVAIVTSGVKSLLDVVSTREALETLGVPVVGYRCDRFPAFYLRDSDAGVDARFDDVSDLSAFVAVELSRSRRAVVIANPVPPADAIDAGQWQRWLAQAEKDASGSTGRDVTPVLLAALHTISGGATLKANLALIRSNAALAGELAAASVR